MQAEKVTSDTLGNGLRKVLRQPEEKDWGEYSYLGCS